MSTLVREHLPISRSISEQSTQPDRSVSPLQPQTVPQGAAEAPDTLQVAAGGASPSTLTAKRRTSSNEDSESETRVPKGPKLEPSTEAAATPERVHLHLLEELPLSEQEKRIIENIVHTVATHSTIGLIWKVTELERMGASINHVHPLRFIGHIIMTPAVKGHMQAIHQHYFKWRGVLGGFQRRMAEEGNADNLKKYVPDFCKQLNIPEKQSEVESHIEHKSFENLLRMLIH